MKDRVKCYVLRFKPGNSDNLTLNHLKLKTLTGGVR
jgi:hypothetical protein